ncbi:MAG: hypothetical protein JWP57_693, partial [Spirosoma sp.]|nr:hypothetical protein [Spirosoma sp.]
HYVLKPGLRYFAILPLFGQQHKLMPLEKGRQVLIQKGFKRGIRHERIAITA